MGRREYLRAIHDRYRRGSDAKKGTILDEFCRVCDGHRKHAIRLLRGPRPPAHSRRRRPRGPSYGPAVIRALAQLWEAAGYPWSVRLKAMLPLWLPWLRKRMALTPELEHQLRAISPRQIDHRLQSRKRVLRRRLYGRTKPGTLLKHHIPIKTDHWDVSQPGFTEIDLVSHSGDCAKGLIAGAPLVHRQRRALLRRDHVEIHLQRGPRLGSALRQLPQQRLLHRRQPAQPRRVGRHERRVLDPRRHRPLVMEPVQERLDHQRLSGVGGHRGGGIGELDLKQEPPRA